VAVICVLRSLQSPTHTTPLLLFLLTTPRLIETLKLGSASTILTQVLVGPSPGPRAFRTCYCALHRRAVVGQVDEDLDSQINLSDIQAAPLKPIVHG